jgi:predicted nucleic acid-binding protein
MSGGGLKQGSRRPKNAAHLAAKKELWKRALTTKRVSLAEIEAAALDAESRHLLQVSLQLAGVEIVDAHQEDEDAA